MVESVVNPDVEGHILVPDTHANLEKVELLIQKLSRLGLLATRRLCFLGDLVDRGPNAKGLVDYVMHLCVDDGHTIVAGNHDYVLARVLDRADPYRSAWVDRWARNYESGVLNSYGVDAGASWLEKADQLAEAMPNQHVDFLRRMPWVYETADIVAVHAGIDPHINWDIQRDNLMTKRETGRRGPSQLFSHNFAGNVMATIPGKTLVSGHLSRYQPYVSSTRVMLDCGVDSGGPLASWVSDTNDVIMVD